MSCDEVSSDDLSHRTHRYDLFVGAFFTLGRRFGFRLLGCRGLGGFRCRLVFGVTDYVFFEQAAARTGGLDIRRFEAAFGKFAAGGRHDARFLDRRLGLFLRLGLGRFLGLLVFRLGPLSAGCRRLAGLFDEGDDFADFGFFAFPLEDLCQYSGYRGRQVHRGLVGLDLNEYFVEVDTVADGFTPVADLHFGDRLAGLGDFQFNGHGLLSGAHMRGLDAPRASSMIFFCSSSWEAWDPVAGLADSGREMLLKGHLPKSRSPKRMRI